MKREAKRKKEKKTYKSTPVNRTGQVEKLKKRYLGRRTITHTHTHLIFEYMV